MKIKEVLHSISDSLKNNNITAVPFLESRILLTHALKLDSQESLLMNLDLEISEAQKQNAMKMLSRRIKKEPIAYILGYKEFWDFKFKVDKNVLIPRPETEAIIESIIKYFPNKAQKLSIIDLGTGSGCIPITLLKIYTQACAIGLDISEHALRIANSNAKKLQVGDRIKLIQSNWLDNISQEHKFDIITANPPYISFSDWNELEPEVKNHEPRGALTDFTDGLTHYHIILQNIHKYTKPNSKIFLEIGYNQSQKLALMLQQYKFTINEIIPDLANIPRIIVCQSI
jgi:release factor glutamine methyltransferase